MDSKQAPHHNDITQPISPRFNHHVPLAPLPIIAMSLGTDLILLDQLRQLVSLRLEVWNRRAHHLVSYPRNGCQLSVFEKIISQFITHFGASPKVSIFALHRKLSLLQLAASNAAINLVSSFSLSSISSLAVRPIMIRPVSSKQLSHWWLV